MIWVSEAKTTPPDTYRTPLQELVYITLDKLSIPYERVDNEPAVTMEDCIAVDERLNMKTVKTLFLTNRQQTLFYLFVTPGDKPFRSKDFGAALEVSRVSFASAEKLLEMATTEPGSATVFSLLLDSMKEVRLIIDSEVLKSEYYGCTDGTTTGYMKLKTDDVMDKLIPHTGHRAEIITL